MKPAAFAYARPDTVENALILLAGNDAVALAGGQSLVPLLAERSLTPSLVVDIGRITALRGINRGSHGRASVPPCRSPRSPRARLCIELTMDRIAREMGIDRAELRRRNMLTPADMPSDRGTAIVLAGKVAYDSGDYPGCLDRALALALAGWQERASRAEDARAQARLFGTGIACFVEETAIGPYEIGTVREKALLVAAEMLQAEPGLLTWVDGEARTPSGASATLAAIAARATAWNPMPGGLTSFNLADEAHHQVPGIAFANATHVCDIEIDPETGELAVTGYAVAHDCGTVINPMIVEGQVIGGIAQGLGGTLFEELRYDAQGRPLTRSFADYLVPTAADMPRAIRTGSMESPSPLNPFGMKGAGEGGTTGSVAAIASAIADALAPLGVRVTGDGPFTPPTILRMIKDGAPTGAGAGP